jgi:hypothetical protein
MACMAFNTVARAATSPRPPAVARIDRASVGKAGSVRQVEPAHGKHVAEFGARITASGSPVERDGSTGRRVQLTPSVETLTTNFGS